VKEAFNVAGLPTTWGLPAFKDWRPPEDAVVVERLKAAGAIIIGKTNVPVVLADWQSTNPVHGTTNNPYDIEPTPAGSSGGAAAAPDEQSDGVGWRLVLPRPRHNVLRDFRVLLIDTHPLGATAEAIRTALADLADRLGKQGVAVARQSPLLPDLAEATRNYMRLLGPVLTRGRPPEYYERMRSIAAAMGPDNQGLDAIFIRGANVGWREWAAAAGARTRLQRQWATLFKQCDVVLCPPMPTAAFKHDVAEMSARRLDVD